MAESVNAPAPTHTSLSRSITRLRWILFKRSFRKNVGLLIGTIIGGLYAVGGLAFLGSLLFGALFIPDEDVNFATIVRGFGIVLLLAWTVIPIVSFGLDDTLSPRRFAVFGRPARELLPPIFIASIVSIPVVFTLIGLLEVTVATAIWIILGFMGASAASQVGLAGGIAGLILLLPSAALAFGLCLLISRAFFTWRSTIVLPRRTREIVRGVALVVILGLSYGLSLLFSSGATMAQAFLTLSSTAYRVALWTPIGAPLSIPADVAQGRWVEGLARLAIALVAAVLLWKWWERSFARGLTDALHEAKADANAKVSALVPRLLPSNALGAVVGKSLRYWRRDTRYSVALLIMPLVSLFLVALSVLNSGQSFSGWMAIALTTWMGGITISNEVGFDGPSSWVNITAGINNRANLLGRYLALGLFIMPWLLFLCILVPLLQGAPQLIVLAIPSAFGFLFSSWGISMLVTAYIPYPAPAPGSMKNSSAGTAWISMLSAFVGTWLPMIPSIILIVVGLFFVPGLEYAGAFLALVVGAVTLWLGLRWAATRLDNHYAEAFQAVRSFTS